MPVGAVSKARRTSSARAGQLSLSARRSSAPLARMTLATSQSFDFGIGAVSVRIIQAAPHILTVVPLAGFIGRAVPPKAGGIPYTKER